MTCTIETVSRDTLSSRTEINDTLRQCLLDRHVRYVSILGTFINWFRNRHRRYTFMDIAATRQKFKTSDTLFVLGSAESINEVTEVQWSAIRKCDSVGLNWWPIHSFIPTYYSTNYPRNRDHFRYFQSTLRESLSRYTRTVFFISGNRSMCRGIHPRLVPDLFPDPAHCCIYEYVNPIPHNGTSMQFDPEVFERTLYYRGGLSLVFHLMNQLGYENIVLMGVDLKNRVHFYDYYPEMQWQFDLGYSEHIDAKLKLPHRTMETHNGAKLPIEDYIYSVNNSYFKGRGINLYVGSGKSILAKEIPIYDFSK